jgi:ferrochelatase
VSSKIRNKLEMTIKGKKGVLLVNLGTPDAPTRSAVYRYLKQFLLDGRVIDINPISRNLLVRGIIAPFRSGKSAKEYKKLWTPEGSPLKIFGYNLRDGVQDILGEEFIVKLAMRYQNPSIESAIDELIESKVTQIIVVPLFPQYSSACVGSIHEEVMRLLSKRQGIPALKMIHSYFDYAPMIEAFAARGNQYDIESYDHVLFSYHGVPVRHITKGDDFNHCKLGECCNTITPTNQHCYRANCFATTRAIAKRLNISEDNYSLVFQSRLGNDPWLEPYTSDVIEKLAEQGKKRVLVFCPAFIADCLETVIEIGEEYQEEFEEFGGEKLQLVEGLNDHPLWIKAVSELVLEQV